jgi:hypothetical protein
VREAGQRPLLNHFALQQDLPHKLADARRLRLEMKIGVGTRAADGIDHFAKSAPEQENGGQDKNGQYEHTEPGRIRH